MHEIWYFYRAKQTKMSLFYNLFIKLILDSYLGGCHSLVEENLI